MSFFIFPHKQRLLSIAQASHSMHFVMSSVRVYHLRALSRFGGSRGWGREEGVCSEMSLVSLML